ncbi:MAG: Hsp70 family protein [Treponema sp.]|jgi:molecular chaperone DnaK (HSP70)|nr:Hsp70 family protein [Treponema sp.]
MASTIGIKTANGEFYPVLEENSTIKKRLILTTVHNKQASVYVDLYKSDNQTISEDGYIGSLVVEHIRGKPKGEPSIELLVSSNKNGEITAEAGDLDPASKGSRPCLNVSLASLEQEAQEFPDFVLDHQDRVSSETADIPWLKLFLLFLCITIVCFGLWFFLFSGFRNGSQGKLSEQAESILIESAVSVESGDIPESESFPEAVCLELEAVSEVPELEEPWTDLNRFRL